MIRFGPLGPAVILLAFVCIALGLHHRGLDGPMHYDSVGRLAANEHVFADQGLSRVLEIFPQRPLPMVTFYLNYLMGGMEPVLFRAVNLALLGGAAFALVILMDLVLGMPGPWSRGTPSEKKAVALAFGVLFLVHPLQTYVGLYIWQRMALMGCLFYYSALAVYFAVRTGRLANRAAGYGLCFLLFLAALLSKENTVTLPLVLILAEIAFFREDWKNVAKRGALYAGVLLLTVGVLSLLERAHGHDEAAAGIIGALTEYYQESGLTPIEVILTQCRVLFSYLSVAALPVPSSVQLTSPQVISRSILDPASTLPAVAGAAALVTAGVYLLRKRPLTGFGILFFVVNLLPESLLVPQYLCLGYRVILPMFGLFLVAADCVTTITAKLGDGPTRKWSRVGLAILFLVATTLSVLVTVSKAATWRDPVLLWSDVVSGFPSGERNVEAPVRGRALHNLGAALQEKGNYSEASPVLERALKLRPKSAKTHALLGRTRARMGDLPEAERLLNRALDISPEFPDAHGYMAMVLVRRGRFSEAAAHGQRAVNLAPHRADSHNTLGYILAARGDPVNAVHHFREAVRLSPRWTEARFNLGKALFDQGKIGESIVQFREALALDPGYWPAHANLGAALAGTGRLREAATHFSQALKINPNHAPTRKNLDRARESLRTSQE